MGVADWLGVALVAAIAVGAVLLERVLERRQARSAWGEFLRHDALGRTVYVPFGDVAYVVDDPAVIRRVERLCARGFGLLEAGGLCLGALVAALVALEWHSLIAAVALGAAAGWGLVIAWSVREARAISRRLAQGR